MKQQLPRIVLSFFIICLLTACSIIGRGGISNNFNSPALQAITAAQGPQHIALLLPTNGGYADSAQAVRNGFLAAYYEDKQNNSSAPTVTVLDSSGDINSAYNQAIANGADMVVGPLTKPQVQALAKSDNIKVLTLALNTLDNNQRVPTDFFQFGLSPRDEAVQAAEKAYSDGHRNVIIIAPSDPWGQGIASTFTDRWKSLGGQVTDALAFAPDQDLSAAITNLMHVTPLSQQNLNQQRALIKNTPANQMRRQDFDVIFLVASPQQARLIQPLLKFNFAGGIPIYATSSIYSGVPTPSLDRDLDGIIFCDMPWVLDDPSQLPGNLADIRTRILSLWPDSFNTYSKLYAFGIDAYSVATHISSLANQGSLSGATGTLYIGPDQIVHRKLMWAEMNNGTPAPL